MPFCKTVIVGLIILAASCFQANTQGRSAQTLIEVLQAFIESKQGRIAGRAGVPGVMGASQSEHNAVSTARELSSLVKNEIPKRAWLQSGHLLDSKRPLGKILSAADSRFVEAQPGIVQSMLKQHPVSQQEITEIVKAELLKTEAKDGPYVKFDVLNGKLSIDAEIHKGWVSLAFGDVNLYGVTVTVGGAIAVCYEHVKDDPEAALATKIEKCVVDAISKFRSDVAKKIFEGASTQQVQALLEEYYED